MPRRHWTIPLSPDQTKRLTDLKKITEDCGCTARVYDAEGREPGTLLAQSVVQPFFLANGSFDTALFRELDIMQRFFVASSQKILIVSLCNIWDKGRTGRNSLKCLARDVRNPDFLSGRYGDGY